MFIPISSPSLAASASGCLDTETASGITSHAADSPFFCLSCISYELGATEVHCVCHLMPHLDLGFGFITRCGSLGLGLSAYLPSQKETLLITRGVSSREGFLGWKEPNECHSPIVTTGDVPLLLPVSSVALQFLL